MVQAAPKSQTAMSYVVIIQFWNYQWLSTNVRFEHCHIDICNCSNTLASKLSEEQCREKCTVRGFPNFDPSKAPCGSTSRHKCIDPQDLMVSAFRFLSLRRSRSTEPGDAAGGTSPWWLRCPDGNKLWLWRRSQGRTKRWTQERKVEIL